MATLPGTSHDRWSVNKMIALRPLRLTDRKCIEGLVSDFPPYSDFDFASLWAWNIEEDAEWCELDGSVVLKMRDYQSGDKLYTLFGVIGADDIADDLLKIAANDGPASLILVPEYTALALDQSRFGIEPSPDHFDYVYNVADHVTYDRSQLKAHRRRLNTFRALFPFYQAEDLRLNCPMTRAKLAGLWEGWRSRKSSSTEAEWKAFTRFLDTAHLFPHVATGVLLHDRICAFDVTVLGSGGCGNSLFAKADTTIPGIYSVLQHEAAKRLLAAGCERVNFEQDLGLVSLRNAKRSFRPESYLRKYTVRRRTPCVSNEAAVPISQSAPPAPGRLPSQLQLRARL